MTLRRHIVSMTGVSNPSWITQSTTFIAGWSKSWRTVIRTLSANILTLRRRSTAKASVSLRSLAALEPEAHSAKPSFPMLNRLLAGLLSIALIAGVPLNLEAQASRSRKRSHKPKPAPCKEGCKTETTTPELAATTPEDGALQKDLAELGRALRTGAPGT